MTKRCFSIVVASLALFLGLSFFTYAQQNVSPEQAAPEKETGLSRVWENKKISITTFEEDIQTVLRAIARLINLPVTFGEGITDTVSLDLEDYPAKKVFDMLMDEYALDYTMDADSIHVFKRGVVSNILISLENLTVDEARNAIERFGLLKKELKIVFDEATNTIFISGRPGDIGNIQNLIETLESQKLKQIEIREVKVRPVIRYFPLRYAKVSDITLKIGKNDVTVKGLMTVLTEILGLTPAGEKTPLKTVEAVGVEKQPQAEKAINAVQQEKAGLLKTIVRAEAGTITSDPRTNQIIIRDYPEKLDEYAKIIKALDQPMKMVKIDVMIVEASKDFAREVGISFSGRNQYTDTPSRTTRQDFGTSAEARDVFDETLILGAQTAINLIPLPGTAAGTLISPYGIAGTYLYQGATSTLAIVLQAAEAKGISKVINKSSIVTMDNMEAIVQSLVTITVITTTILEDTQTQEELEIDAGIILNATPHIIETEDKKTLIELVITVERSAFLPAPQGGIPPEASTSLNTQAVVGNNNTLVIGGFFDTTYAKGKTGIPCLMNMPGLGYFFRTSAARNPKSNLLFFLTPTVISLDKIPHETDELRHRVDRYEGELKRIDPEKGNELIEKLQD